MTGQPSNERFDLCSLDELRERGTLCFEFVHPRMGRHEVGLFWDGEGAFALENACPHELGTLSFGFVEPGQVVCPMHAAVFDLRTGECLDKYTYDTAAYETTVRDGRVWVAVPGEVRSERNR